MYIYSNYNAIHLYHLSLWTYFQFPKFSFNILMNFSCIYLIIWTFLYIDILVLENLGIIRVKSHKLPDQATLCYCISRSSPYHSLPLSTWTWPDLGPKWIRLVQKGQIRDLFRSYLGPKSVICVTKCDWGRWGGKGLTAVETDKSNLYHRINMSRETTLINIAFSYTAYFPLFSYLSTF